MRSSTSKPKRISVTIRDVAGKAGVSIATVSRVLHSSAPVSEEVRQRVQQAAAELNYLPNKVARNLRMNKTQLVGVIVTDIENPYFTSIIRSIESVLLDANYFLVLFNSDEDENRERDLLNILRSENVAGVILVPCMAGKDMYQELMKAGIPLVMIDRLPPADLKVDLVTIDGRQGARAAVNHLIELGHRRIGLVSGPLHSSTARDRKAGYENALKDHSIPPASELVTYGDFKQKSGYEAMSRLLELDQPPTAVLSGNNLMTLGALQAIHERGLSIPDQLSLIGYDDMPWGMSLEPPLSAVAQPTNELGAEAARLLLERIRKPQKKFEHIQLETRLVLRASSEAPGH